MYTVVKSLYIWIPSPLTPCYFQVDASFISRLPNTDDIDRPIYGLSAQIAMPIPVFFGGNFYAWNLKEIILKVLSVDQKKHKYEKTVKDIFCKIFLN